MTSTTPDPAIVATIPQEMLEEIVRDADVAAGLRARADALEHARELAQAEIDRRRDVDATRAATERAWDEGVRACIAARPLSSPSYDANPYRKP